MSADNRICIMMDENCEYAVWEGSLSADYYDIPTNAERFKTKQEAWGYAQTLADKYTILEGGIMEISKEEQLKGLVYEIEDLTTRLRLLVVSGKQFDNNYN